MPKFRAIVLDTADGKPKASFKELSLTDLPDHDVLVEVEYSSLNFKDGLAVSGKQKIARTTPLIAGIDLAGTVSESRSPDWKPGDRVVVTGYGLSETQHGGYTQFQRVKPEWLMRVPDALGLQAAMAIGTAGLTAALCINALKDWGVDEGGDVLVTGAAGGVGSMAVALLAAQGVRVTASTGRPSTQDYLKMLGAKNILSREEMMVSGPPLQKERWAAAIDSVGGSVLVNALSQIRYGGAAAACGLAGGAELPRATVLPHILRGVALLGVDSVMASFERRQRAWHMLSTHLDRQLLSEMASVRPMSELPSLANQIISGEIRGRVVIDVKA